jgi:hypothetical protein
MTALLTFPVKDIPEGYELVAVMATIFFSMTVLVIFGRIWGEND